MSQQITALKPISSPPILDTRRHQPVFDPLKFPNLTIDVIGCGATGSKIIMSLAKLGLKRLRIWDKDLIEEHNIANQIFLMNAVGHSKALTLSSLIDWQHIDARNEFYTGQEPLGDVVFLLVDSMKARQEIFDNSIRLNKTRLMIETRMGSDMGIIYQIDPRKPSHIEFWNSKMFKDEDAEVSACGSSISVGPTGDILAGFAVWKLMQWLNNGEQIDVREFLFCTTGETLFNTVN